MKARYEKQLAMYSSYHRDSRNRLTHFFGVPAIILALLIPLARLPILFPGIELTVAVIVATAVMAYWVFLDLVVGLATSVGLAVGLVAAHRLTGLSSGDSWILFALLFVGGWILQLVGHVFEGRRPALVDNIAQVFVAPLFLVSEVLGRRPSDGRTDQ